jgi:hypothetical protein
MTVGTTDKRRARRVVNLEAQWPVLMARALLSRLMRGRKYTKKHRMERSKNLELHLTEAELETLVNAVRNTSDGRFAELEFKLRAAWRRALSQSDYRSAILTLVESVQFDNFLWCRKALRGLLVQQRRGRRDLAAPRATRD